MSCLELSFTVRIPTAIVPRETKRISKNMETLKNTLYDDDINDEIRKRDLTEEHIVKSRSAQIENYLK